MSNVGALDQVRTFLRAHPNLHRQSTWACGTTACIAGWTVALNEGKQAGDWLSDDDFTSRNFAQPARHILGLSRDEAHALFHDWNETQALALVDAIIARDKGDLTDDHRSVLAGHSLPDEPAGDAA
jgi:hypothetical protein